ncbi:hypothetical protein GCM10009080_58250 [Cupriavidus pauculus]
MAKEQACQDKRYDNPPNANAVACQEIVQRPRETSGVGRGDRRIGHAVRGLEENVAHFEWTHWRENEH